MRFGIFLAPFHPVGQNPTLALHRDLELVEWLDQLGFDEAWIGEHHSAGYEIIASPEVFIAVVSQRTKQIRLGTGVSSLPYHHPLMLADRMVLLDHLTHGRVMLGVGPGALPSDAFMMGIDPREQRRMMEESLEAIVRLLNGERVTMSTDWFTLRDAKLQVLPYSKPTLEIGVAAMVSPSGPRAAGRFGIGLLSIGATQQEGFNALENAWSICEDKATEHGQAVDRTNWRLVGPMHIAPTREQALEDVKFGLADWIDYFVRVAALPIVPEGIEPDQFANVINDSGMGVIGSPDDAIAQIERLEKQSGGFGCYLNMAHEWADRQATMRSYELMARYVFPRFQPSAESTTTSRDWTAENRPEFIGAATEAIMSSIQQHAAEQEAKQGN